MNRIRAAFVCFVLSAWTAVGVPVAAQGAGPLAAGERALAAGKLAEAAVHLQLALAAEPERADIAALLVEASGTDSDTALLWAHHAVSLAADASGRGRPDGVVKKALGKDTYPTKLASARAAAVRELISFAARGQKRAGRTPAEGLVAAWARGLAWEIARGVPALEAELIGEPPPRVIAGSDVYEPVLSALERELTSALAGSRAGDALELARALHGFSVQAGYEDLQGELPTGVERMRTTAATAMRKARSMMERNAERPWTVEELEWLSQAEGETFTRGRSSFASPGVAISPNGLYRIESDCGHETLLGVARTIELHHRRLVDFFGSDPFEGRPGLVRIVPEAWGLEAEGAPFWWAGGFQGGDTTTVRFSCGTIEGLGHTLTHELTHRFDGALLPGQPAWLVEGKAVWTAAAYGASTDAEFVANHAISGTVQGAFIDGFGREEKLGDLIRGEPEDYRDNYVAGYALYLYLRSWEQDGKLLFAERLNEYMQTARTAKGDGLERFSKHFCDGVDGRPKGFPAFAAAFGTFIEGFYWRDPKPWTERYVSEVEGIESPLVLDEPTWVWSRRRAEPYFGTDQARRAGELFQRLGKHGDALTAYAWALAVDGRDPRIEARLLPLLEEVGEEDASWVVRRSLAGPFGRVGEPAPFWNKLSKTRALITLLQEAETSYRERDRSFAAEVFRADRARFEAQCGVEDAVSDAWTGGSREGRAHPFDEPARRITGWAEDGLTDFEDLRQPGLWFATPDGSLIVGRDSARTGTGRFDRQAHNRHAFARSEAWIGAGRYRISGRVRFSTVFATGALVLGYARRDQNVRVHFRGGDYLFAIGESEEEPKFEDIRWRFDGLRERDGPLNAAMSGVHTFHTPTPTFEFELVVDGSSVEAWFDGVLVGTYHTVDGAPIEGFVGFATSYGAIEVQNPTITRLDRGRFARAPWTPPGVVALDQEIGIAFDELTNRPFSGLPPSTNGSVLVWTPMPWRDEDPDFDPERIAEQGFDGARLVSRVLKRQNALQPFFVAAPKLLGEERLADLRARLATLDPPATLVLHAGTGLTPPGLEDAPDHGKRWVLFVDPFGVVRVCDAIFGGPFQTTLGLWLDVFRDVGHPARTLPPLTRQTGDEEVGEPGSSD